MLPQLLYHGTTREYHDEQLARWEMYTHGLSGPLVCLDGHIASPWGYAIKRARYHHANPLLLIVDTSKVVTRLKDNLGMPEIKVLNRGEYIALDIPKNTKDHAITEQFFERLRTEIRTNFDLEFSA